MSIKVTFVAQVGRDSLGNMTALPKVEAFAAEFGGKVIGGEGSSSNPIVAEFPSLEQAAACAKRAWFDDSIEYAKVLGVDGPGPGAIVGKVAESADQKDPPSTDGQLDDAELAKDPDGVGEAEELHSTVSGLWNKHTDGDDHPGSNWNKWNAFYGDLKGELGEEHGPGLKYLDAASEVGDGPDSAAETVSTLLNAKKNARCCGKADENKIQTVDQAIDAVVEGADVSKVVADLLG